MKSNAKTADITIKTQIEVEGTITMIEITPDVEIAAEDCHLRIWCAGKEIRIGPLTERHVAALEDDIGYAFVKQEG